MALNTSDLAHLVRYARAYLRLVDATTISQNDGIQGGGTLTRDELATLIGRFYRETEPWLSRAVEHGHGDADLT